MENNSLPEVVNHGGINFKDKLAELKTKGFRIYPSVWDILYLYLADYLSVINLLCGYYLKRNMAVSVVDCEKIRDYNRKASHIIDVIIYPDKIQDDEIELLDLKNEAPRMEKELKNFLDHYLKNRLNAIGMIIEYTIDKVDPNPLPVEHTKKIYNDSSQIISILEGIRRELQGIDRVQV